MVGEFLVSVLINGLRIFVFVFAFICTLFLGARLRYRLERQQGSKKAPPDQFYLDIVAIGCVPISFMYAFFLFTMYDVFPELIIKWIIFIAMLMAGFFTGVILDLSGMPWLRPQPIPPTPQLVRTVTYGMYGFIFSVVLQVILIFTLQMSIFPAMSTATGGAIPHGVVVGFYTQAAISEEFFFRGFFFVLWLKVTRHWVAANVITSITFSGYHAVVYGSHPAMYIVLFVSSMVMGYTMWKSKSLTSPLMMHLLQNISSSWFSMFLLVG